MTEAHTGAVAAIQRTDSVLRLNVHFHLLVLDGVYVRAGKSGLLVFYKLSGGGDAFQNKYICHSLIERRVAAFTFDGRRIEAAS